MKGVGRIHQQTFIDTYDEVAFAKLYDRKTPITAADLLNDRVVPFYRCQRGKALPRADRSRHGILRQPQSITRYELYQALEDVDHSRAQTKSPQTNGITLSGSTRRCSMSSIASSSARRSLSDRSPNFRADLDAWVQSYNEDGAHQGRWCFGKTPMQTFLDATPLAKEKMIAT